MFTNVDHLDKEVGEAEEKIGTVSGLTFWNAEEEENYIRDFGYDYTHF